MNTETKEFDVVICGAGPAGSTCALAVAGRGLRVALLDKSSFPRDKICGDAIAAYVPKVLGTIHPSHEEAVHLFQKKKSVNTIRIYGPNTRHADVTFKKDGFIARRTDFDHFLFERAQACSDITVFSNHTVSDVTHVPGGMAVRAGDLLINTKLVIACDGANSVVRRKLMVNDLDYEHHAGAVRAYYRNVNGIPDNTFELHFLKGILPGYFWIFPLQNNMANVGLGLLSARISRDKISLRQLLLDVIRDTPQIAPRFSEATMEGKIEGFGLPLGSRKLPISGDNFMLCGDAASLIDPLSGEGIGQAMVSGRYAGWHAAECFRQNNFTAAFMKTYDDMVYAKFWKKHRTDHLIQKLIYDRDWLFDGIMSLAHSNAWLKKVLVKTFM